MITVADAIILGLVQGLTEFIPVSSSGHLVLIDKFTSIESSFTFDVLINVGTIAALVIFFRKTLLELAKNASNNSKLLRNIVLSTIPAVIVGGLFSSTFESEGIRAALPVIAMLLAVGVAMMLESRLKTDSKLKSKSLSKLQALSVGLAQAVALIPGTSRSGITILGGRAFGLSPTKAAEYSFLIAIPILTGAVLKELFSGGTIGYIEENTTAIITGVLVSFVAGYVAISTMLKYLRKQGLRTFGIYRIMLALVLLLILI